MRLIRAVAVAALLACAVLAGAAAVPATAAPAAPLRTPTSTSGESTALTLLVAPDQVATGRSTTLRGRLVDAATGSGLADSTVRLEATTPQGTWAEVAALTSDAAGEVTTTQLPAETTAYRFHHGDLGSAQESLSPAVQVTVRTLTAELARDAVRAGRPVEVRGVLAAEGGSALHLEERRDGAWRPAGDTQTAADGSYAFTVAPAEPGLAQYRVVRDAGAGWSRSAATLPLLDVFRLHTYSVTTRGVVHADMGVFRSVVAATYADPHGWLRAHHRFREVQRGGDFTVILSQARFLPAFSWVCSPTYSCQIGRFVIINQDRWQRGSRHFPADLLSYRRMLVNHETGHWLGLGHAYCARPGAPAPVMQQQSKGMHGCRANPWPRPGEIEAVS